MDSGSGDNTMVYYEMDAPQVHTAGQQVAGQTTVAAALAQRYGTVLSTAETTVQHTTMVSAVRRYTDLWKPPADLVATRVQTLGVGTSTSAVTISETDLDAEQCLRGPYYLNRGINEPPVCPGI